MTNSFNEKLIGYLALLSGLCISAVAVYYSVVGLTAIFAAAAVPIIIMGTTLEVSKLVATVWLKQNWSRSPLLIKSYLVSAVVVLMFVTSMGIFGFLSKAHLDQAVPTGDVVDKIAIIDEKIKTQKENIDASRKVLKQMDDSVDQLMSRTTDERGAVRSSALRKSQQKERDQLRLDIETAQHTVQQLNEQKAPLAKEIRQVEAEVGPIKYIAAFFYGSTDQTVLEKAVTWVIIVLISVFDPLAVILLLASQVSFDNLRNRNKEEETAPVYEPDDGPLTDDQVEQIKELAKEDLPEGELIVKDELFPEEDHHSIDHRSLIIDHWVKLAKSKRVKMADIPPEYLAEVKPRV